MGAQQSLEPLQPLHVVAIGREFDQDRHTRIQKTTHAVEDCELVAFHVDLHQGNPIGVDTFLRENVVERQRLYFDAFAAAGTEAALDRMGAVVLAVPDKLEATGAPTGSGLDSPHTLLEAVQ